MNIAIVGYGRMGKEIESLAKERDIRVSKIFRREDNPTGSALTQESLRDADVCIEFTRSASVIDNIRSIAKAKRNIVVGTTGWYDQLADVEKLVKTARIGLVYSPNFSLGVNLFYHIVTAAARLFDKFDAYDVAVSEIHHREKVDSPSGTALALGNIVIQNVRRKKEILHETAHAKVKPGRIHVTSTRVGSVVGKHSVVFDSDADTIELVHNAKNRRGFAMGALIAAEWLKGKKGVYTMKDVLSSL